MFARTLHSSRLGFTDGGVNAKRFNWWAARLGGLEGWKTAPIRSKGHEDYFTYNGLNNDKVK